MYINLRINVYMHVKIVHVHVPHMHVTLHVDVAHMHVHVYTVYSGVSCVS